MAEFVQQRLEELLPELEQLVHVQLFTRDEINAVVAKRREFEYRLQRTCKSLDDYRRYIDYERTFLRLIWKRRERYGYEHKRAEIDQRIMARVSQLYRIACIRFSDCVAIFLSHVQFCIDSHQLAQGSRVFTRLLRLHGADWQLWLRAAQYELHQCSSIDSCRALMMRALRLHAEVVPLWTGYARLELEYVGILRRRLAVLANGSDVTNRDTSIAVVGGGLDDFQRSDRDDQAVVADECESKENEVDEEDPVLRCAVVEAVINEAIVRVPEASARANACHVIAAMLAVCAEFVDTASDLSRRLIDKLTTDYGDQPLAYDTVARSTLQDRSHGAKLCQRLQQCCEVYERGLNAVGDCESMWSMYLTSLLDVLCQAPKHTRAVLARLDSVYQRAHSAKALKLAEYVRTGEVLLQAGASDKAVGVLRDGTDRFPTSGALRLNLIKALSSEVEISSCISAALVAVPDSDTSVSELWLAAFDWCCQHEPHRVSNLYTNATYRSPAVLRRLHAPYLQWVAANSDIERVRAVFADMTGKQPSALCDCSLYESMIALERKHSRADSLDEQRKLYRLAVQHVGNVQWHLWLEYFQFERENGKGKAAAIVYDQAVKQLPGEMSDAFVAQLTLVNNNAIGCS